MGGTKLARRHRRADLTIDRVSECVRTAIRRWRIVDLETIENIKDRILAVTVLADEFRCSEAFRRCLHQKGMTAQRSQRDDRALGIQFNLNPDFPLDMRDPGHLWKLGLATESPFQLRVFGKDSGADVQNQADQGQSEHATTFRLAHEERNRSQALARAMRRYRPLMAWCLLPVLACDAVCWPIILPWLGNPL